jgi:hypothetical protein
MYRAVDGKQTNYCDACFSGNYRLGEMLYNITWKGMELSNSGASGKRKEKSSKINN